MENSEENCDVVGLGELPENCISTILSFTTPMDVCTLARLSSLWRSASNADMVWERLITQHFGQNLSKAISHLPFSSRKELYFCLTRDHGNKRIWMDEFTGKIGCMLPARDLCIAWGDNPRYWEWVSVGDSRFEQVAKLRGVWWFDVWQRFKCTILSPNTRYTVSFIVKMDDNRARRRYNAYPSPIKFSLTTPEGDCRESARFMDDLEREVESHGGFSMTPVIHDERGWMEFQVGEFFLGEDGEVERDIVFSMKNIDCSFTKQGILVDGVKIQPSSGQH